MTTLRPLLAAPFWVAAAACIAFPVIDHSLGWADAFPKRLFIVTVFLALLLGSLWGAWKVRRGVLRWLPFAVLLAAAGNEALQQMTRARYWAGKPKRSVGPQPSLLRPVTTTDLVTHFYVVPSNALRVSRLRVAQITDLHVSAQLPSGYFESALATVAESKPDLILMTGDYVSQPGNLPLLARLLPGRLHAPLGVFAVLGNHDYWTDAEAVRQILRSAGVTLVSASCVRLPEALGKVVVCGSEEPWGPKLTTPLSPRDLSLVLSHTPDNIYDLAELGASAVFSGHTHGGQMRVPGLGALVLPSRFGRRFDEGAFHVGGADLFISTGLGVDAPALRVYCQPDIVVVDFVKNPAN